MTFLTERVQSGDGIPMATSQDVASAVSAASAQQEQTATSAMLLSAQPESATATGTAGTAHAISMSAQPEMLGGMSNLKEGGIPGELPGELEIPTEEGPKVVWWLSLIICTTVGLSSMLGAMILFFPIYKNDTVLTASLVG
jgi:hypothetical protein